MKKRNKKSDWKNLSNDEKTARREEKINSALSGLLEQFKSGEIADTVAMATFPPVAGIPSTKWSLLNRVLMVSQGTADARGFKQWKEAGRNVVKGSKAFSILGPRIVQVENAEGEKEPRLIGFISIPVFPVENTEGKALDYESIPVPDVPLIDVAIKWGISVKSVPGNNRFQGMFRAGRREILLATPEESVFFHELAHAAHEKVLRARGDTMKGGQNAKQEMVAELSAAVLSRLCGKSDKDTSGNSYRYIQGYAGKDTLKGIASIIGDVEKVLARIMEAGNVEAIAA